MRRASSRTSHTSRVASKTPISGSTSARTSKAARKRSASAASGTEALSRERQVGMTEEQRWAKLDEEAAGALAGGELQARRDAWRKVADEVVLPTLRRIVAAMP